MNLSNKNLLIVLFLFLFALPQQISAQESNDTIQLNTRQRKLRLGPFFWFVGFKGSVYRPPIPGNFPEPLPPKYDIDVSFRDISSNLKFALMFSSEYRLRKTTFRTSFSSVVLKGKAIAPGDAIFQNIAYRLGYFAGDLSAGRTVLKKDPLRIDALIGFKWTHVSISGSTDIVGSLPFEGDRSSLWLDPMIGTDILYQPLERLELHFYGDFGAIIGSELTYQVISEVNYYCNQWLYLTLGYRLWGIKVDQSEAIYDGQVKGLVFRLGFLL